MRQIFAGMICSFQENLTKYGAKFIKIRAFRLIEHGFLVSPLFPAEYRNFQSLCKVVKKPHIGNFHKLLPDGHLPYRRVAD